MDNCFKFFEKYSSLENTIENSQVLYKNPISESLIEKKDIPCKVKSKNELKFYHIINNLNKLLYERDEIIHIINFNSLEDSIHLAMLIEEDEKCVYFSYEMNLINEINIKKEECPLDLKKLILSKALIRLIENYRGLNYYNEEDEVLLKKIETENKLFINDNINKYKDIGLDSNTTNIEDLYGEIIYNALKKLEKDEKNYEYVEKIFESLSLDSIGITNKMFKRLLELFDNDFVKEYQIINRKDLDDKKKINFYYILLHYILRNPFYIYQFPFLIKTQKFLRELTKANNYYMYIEESKFDKIPYIIDKLLDSNYYNNKIVYIMITIGNSNQTNINENNDNKGLSNLENDLELFKCESGTTHIISNDNISEHNKNNLTDKNNKNKNFEKIEEKENTEKKIKSGVMKNLMKCEKENYLNIILTDKYNHKVDDGVLKCYKIIYEKQYLSGKGDYYINESLSKSDGLVDETFRKKNKLNIDIDGYQIEVHTYNSYISGNDNKLTFYDKKIKKIIKEIEGYSFPISVIGLAVMHNNKILICPCKKYSSENQRGIIYIYFNFKQNQYLTYFHEISHFIVNCICPLLNQEKKETNFILVGGYGHDSSIRLYRISYNPSLKKIEVQFITDIIIIENKLFSMSEKPIHYIKQSKKTGHISIWSNKNIYFCSPLNFNKYLYFDETEKLESLYENVDESEESESFFI